MKSLQAEVSAKLLDRQKMGGVRAMRTLSDDGLRESTFRVLLDGKVTMELHERVDGRRMVPVLRCSEPIDPRSVVLTIDVAVLDGDWGVDVDRSIFLHDYE